jgi:pimeloyl-ACP methyl ester carboxylesterase
LTWIWIGLATCVGAAATGTLAAYLLYRFLCARYLQFLVRIFQEKPLFIVPRGQPVPGTEEVFFPTTDGIALHGCYFRTSAWPRRGVILFGLEFGSNAWACVPYCEDLLAKGFDVFTFEPRNQGESEHLAGYDPLQWVTDYEVEDFQSALSYLKNRPDADRRGVGLFGISKGGSAGLAAAATDSYVLCCVTDGIFATYSTMVPYMRKWVTIYSDRYWIQVLLPTWFYGMVGRAGLRQIAQERHCTFPHLEKVIGRIAPRPLLMIHGVGDTYIKPEMARTLFERAAGSKEFWLVEGAKHNQALQVAGEEYRRRVADFFLTHLAVPGAVETKPTLAEVG